MNSGLFKSASLTLMLATSMSFISYVARADEAPKAAEAQTKDPVVATVNGHNILLSEVIKLKKTLPEKYQSLPEEKLKELLVRELVDLNLIDAAATAAVTKLTGDEKKALDKAIEQAKKDVMAQFFMASVIKGALTEEAIEKTYADLVKNFPATEVRRFSHIVVADEGTAKSVIKALQGGQDFAKLAKAKSTDHLTAQRGGELGFYPKDELSEHIGKDIADTLYAMEVGGNSVEPIKTALGYHIFKVEEKRQAEPPEFEDPKVRRAIEDKLSAQVMKKLIDDLRGKAKITLLDKDGKPLSAEKKAPAATPAKPAAKPAAAAKKK